MTFLPLQGVPLMNAIWENALKIIEENMSPTPFSTWFPKLIPVAMNNEAFLLTITGDNPDLTEKIVTLQYSELIEKAIASVTGKNLHIIIKLNIENDFLENFNKKSVSKEKNSDTKLKDFSADPTYISAPLNPKYVFENFVIGNSNQLAYAAAVAVADAPGIAYNPLFLYGNVGLGKTHLMHSIAHHILEKNPSAKVVYASCETFLTELVVAIQNNKTKEFKDKYRKVDVLLIDDIQFISSKEATQDEFFYTFNAIWELNKQIIISSDRPPKEIATLEDRLRSRFSCGLTADIQSPDFETRLAILKRKATLDNIEMPEEVFNFTAKTITSSIRELEGALTTISGYSRLTGKEITTDLAKLALKNMIINSEKEALSIDYIQNTVADYFGVSVNDLKGKRRSKNIVYPRHVAMYFCRKLLDCPLADIGNSFGGRDHSTVINGYENILKGLEKNSNPSIVKNISDIETILKKD